MPDIIHRYLKITSSNKCPPGLADFLKGSLTLISLSEFYNYNFYFDSSSHPFFDCLEYNKDYFLKIDTDIPTYECIPPLENYVIYNTLISLFESHNNFCLITNYDNIIEIKDNHLEVLKKVLKPNKNLNNKINTILNKTININFPYIICHFRLGDNFMGIDFKINLTLFENLLKCIYNVIKENNDIPRENIIIISDCYDFKMKLKPYNISTIDSVPIHMGLNSNNDLEDIENTMIDFFLMTKTKIIYSFTEHDSSGFSKIVNKLYNIPLFNTKINIYT